MNFKKWLKENFPDFTDYQGRERSIRDKMDRDGVDWFTAGMGKTNSDVRQGEIVNAWKWIVQNNFPGGEFSGSADFADRNVMVYKTIFQNRKIDFTLAMHKQGLLGKDFSATVDFDWDKKPEILSDKDAKITSGDKSATATSTSGGNLVSNKLEKGSLTFMRAITEKYIKPLRHYGINVHFNSADRDATDDEGNDMARRSRIYDKMIQSSGYTPGTLGGGFKAYVPNIPR